MIIKLLNRKKEGKNEVNTISNKIKEIFVEENSLIQKGI